MASYSGLIHGDYIGSMNPKKDVSLLLYSWPTADSDEQFGYEFQVTISIDRTNDNALVCTFNLLGCVLDKLDVQSLEASSRVSLFDHTKAKDLLSFRVRYMRMPS